MAKDLSAKQQSILRFIRAFIEQHDYPPSIRQIQEACRISSTSVVDYNLKALERQGFIRRGRRPRTMAIPIIGRIAAGQPIPVPAADTWNSADYDEVIEVTRDMIGGREDVYGVRVQGSSMIDALVNDGDIVLMQATNSADNGDMVAAWLKREQEATLKHFYREGERVRLQPANETMAPIYTDAANVEIQGKVVLTLRSLR
jgi:repressor LexA